MTRRHHPKKDTREELVRLQYDADLLDVLKTPAGKRLVYRLVFDTCGILTDAFTGNSQTFYSLGKQAVGKFLWSEALRVAPEHAEAAHHEALLTQRENVRKWQAEQDARAKDADSEAED